MTLVEILAICALLSLIAVAIAPVMSNHSQSVDQFVSAWRRSDRALRESAYGRGGIWQLRVGRIEGTLVGASEPAHTIIIPRDIHLKWLMSQTEIDQIRIDRWGRSADFDVVVTTPSSDVMLHGSGLSAWSCRSDVP